MAALWGAVAVVAAVLVVSPRPAEAGVVDLPDPPAPGCLDSVAGAVGLHEGVKTPAGGIVLDVPGPVVQVIVEWIGRDDANTGVSNLDIAVTGPDGTISDPALPGLASSSDPQSDNSIESIYGWWNDITTMFGDGGAGEYTIDIEPFASPTGPGHSWGAAVTVVYDTSPCPGVAEVIWKIGADYVFGGSPAAPSTSDIIVWDWTDPFTEDTTITLRAAHGGADNTAAQCRVSTVWLATGTGTAPGATDVLIDPNGNVVTPGSVEAMIDPFNPGTQPCTASFADPVTDMRGGFVGPQFALVEFDVLVPAGSEWLAMQLESPRDNGGMAGTPESGAWGGGGLLIVPFQEPEQIDPDILLEKTVLAGPDGSCPGVEGDDELVVGAPGDPVTYCFRVVNTGDTYLFPIVIEDPDLGISNLDMTLVSGDDTVPLAPGGELVYSYETVIDGDLVNVATVTGTPTDEDGDPLPDEDDVTDENDAEVQEEVDESTTTTTTEPPPELDAALTAFCDNDTPWLGYEIDAEGMGDGTATITFSEGDDSEVYEVAIGSGQVLWPGAAIDADGNPIDWPGWDQDEDGEWFLNPDNPYSWAREEVDVTVEVNPTFGPVTLTYPPANPLCNAAPPDSDQPTTTTEGDPELPATGSSPGGQALFGALLLLAGAAVVTAEVRTRRR